MEQDFEIEEFLNEIDFYLCCDKVEEEGEKIEESLVEESSVEEFIDASDVKVTVKSRLDSRKKHLLLLKIVIALVLGDNFNQVLCLFEDQPTSIQHAIYEKLITDGASRWLNEISIGKNYGTRQNQWYKRQNLAARLRYIVSLFSMYLPIYKVRVTSMVYTKVTVTSVLCNMLTY